MMSWTDKQTILTDLAKVQKHLLETEGYLIEADAEAKRLFAEASKAVEAYGRHMSAL